MSLMLSMLSISIFISVSFRTFGVSDFRIFRDMLCDQDDSLISSKSERDRIKTEIKVMRKQLKLRKFELLPDRVWTDYLLHYLCRTEQFTLSATCKWCLSKCGMDSFDFSAAFDLDNRYWRENFFNFVDVQQDATLLLDDGKFEMLTGTQRRQFKYFIKFWSIFVEERASRKQQRSLFLEQRASKRVQSAKSSKNSKTSKSIKCSKSDDDGNDSKQHLSPNSADGDDAISKVSSAQSVDDKESKTNKMNEMNQMNPMEVGDAKHSKHSKHETMEIKVDESGSGTDDMKSTEPQTEADDDDLYAEDQFVYDDDHDDRPRGQVLLERIRGDMESMDLMQEDAALRIAIPCDVEQLVIRNCKNRSGELANWVSSVLCHVPRECPVDWLGLENNNFQDRDILKICQGLFERKTQSNLVGLSLSENGNITDKCIQVLLQTVSKKCHKLQFLRLSGCSKLTNKTCQHILDFYSKTYDDDSVQLSFIDLSDNGRINEKGISILNRVYREQQYAPYNVIVRFNCAGTQWKEQMADWSKNIILRPPKNGRF